MADVTVTSSTELMMNFQQAEVAAAERDFAALQTEGGNSLLLSIGTDGVLNATTESPGSTTGWVQTDLSRSLVSGAGGAVVKAFAAAQNRASGAIDIVLVVTAGGQDSVYVSLGNSSADTTWVGNPVWTPLAFDDPGHSLPRLEVADVMISQASDGDYLVADVARNPDDATKYVFRYHLDPTKKLTGRAWNAHDVSGDVDASTVKSCLGRRTKDRVDGLYTLGSIAGRDTLLYQPLYNPFDPGVAASAIRLAPPAGASALAAVGAGTDATDLYVAGGQALHRYPAGLQADSAAGAVIVTSPFLEGVTRLFAYATSDRVVVWALNRALQLVYTQCPVASLDDPKAWSVPLPILEGVVHLSPYLNRANGGNTFFAHTGQNELRKAEQSTTTSTWSFSSITLPPPDRVAKARRFDSYTTRLQLTDAHGRPLPRRQLRLAADQRCGLLVNNRYTVLDAEPIPITADEAGAIVVVEPVGNLQGTRLVVHDDRGVLTTVNPMDGPLEKVSNLKTVDDLSKAVITRPDGSTTPLIDPGASAADKQTVVSALGQAAKAYRALPSDPTSDGATRAARREPAANRVTSVALAGGAATPSTSSTFDLGEALTVAAGDLLSFLESGVEAVLHFVEEVGTDIWHFAAEIGGKVYSFVLDAAQKVAGALEVVFQAVKAKIEDLLDYLSFLFDWKAITRTKDVLKQLVLVHLNQLVDGVADFKDDFAGLLTDVRNAVDDWADIKRDDWKKAVPGAAAPTGSPVSGLQPEAAQSAPGSLLSSHLPDNAKNGTVTEVDAGQTGTGTVGTLKGILDELVEAWEDQGDIITGAIDRIRAEVVDEFDSLSFGEVLQKITAIVVDTLLNTTENIVDTLLDIIAKVARAAIRALDAPIWIPVVSDILEYFGIAISVSVLDLMCFVAAVPATVGFKLATGKAPFSDGDGFSNLLLKPPPIPKAPPPDPGKKQTSALVAWPLEAIFGTQIKPEDRETIFIVLHFGAGAVAMVAGPVAVANAMLDGESSVVSGLATVSGIVGGAQAALATKLAQQHPIQNEHMSMMSMATSTLTLVGKVGFGGYPRLKAGALSLDPVTKKTWGKAGARYDSLIALFSLVPAAYHFYELSTIEDSPERTETILDETSNVCNFLSRILAFPVAVVQEPVTKGVLAGAMGTMTVVYGGLQMAEAVVALDARPAVVEATASV